MPVSKCHISILFLQRTQNLKSTAFKQMCAENYFYTSYWRLQLGKTSSQETHTREPFIDNFELIYLCIESIPIKPVMNEIFTKKFISISSFKYRGRSSHHRRVLTQYVHYRLKIRRGLKHCTFLKIFPNSNTSAWSKLVGKVNIHFLLQTKRKLLLGTIILYRCVYTASKIFVNCSIANYYYTHYFNIYLTDQAAYAKAVAQTPDFLQACLHFTTTAQPPTFSFIRHSLRFLLDHASKTFTQSNTYTNPYIHHPHNVIYQYRLLPTLSCNVCSIR